MQFLRVTASFSDCSCL